MALLVGGCTEYNDQFEGLYDEVKPSNVLTHNYELTAADYTKISDLAKKVATNAEDTAKAESIKTNMYFTETVPAADYVKLLLPQLFLYNDLGSKAFITHRFGEDKPSFLTDLKTVNILDYADYQLAWESETAYVSAFTPTVTASANMSAILKAKFPTATADQYKFVEYNYSAEDATSQSTEVEYKAEDFETQTAYQNITIEGWINKDFVGTLAWAGRSYSGNLYAQVSANNSGSLNQVYLVTTQIDLSNAIAPLFSFDINVGYWNANCLSVLISEDFDGTEGGVTTATWTDLSSNFTIPVTPTTGYGVFAPAGTADLSSYVGKKVYIAFKYDADGRSDADRGTDPKKTTTYQIDNIKVSEEKVALTVPSTEKQYVAYKYNGSTWVTADNSFVALQPADYDAMDLKYISSANAPIYLPNFLRFKFPYALEEDVKTVVYKSGSNQTYSAAAQYTFTNGVWELNDFIVNEIAQFSLKSTGWEFIDTDILIGLNDGIGSNLGDFTTISVVGDQVWAWDSDGYMKMTGYVSGSYFDNEDWLISPAMNLSERQNPVITFDHVGRYFGDSGGSNEKMKIAITVWVSTTSDGTSVDEAEWTKLELPESFYPSGANWTFIPSGELSLVDFIGNSNVRIAFKYLSSAADNAAGTWEVKNVYVYEKTE